MSNTLKEKTGNIILSKDSCWVSLDNWSRLGVVIYHFFLTSYFFVQAKAKKDFPVAL